MLNRYDAWKPHRPEDRVPGWLVALNVGLWLITVGICAAGLLR